MSIFKNILQSIYSHILPTACIVCDAFQGQQLCEQCSNQLATEQLSNYECCGQCGIPLQSNEVIRQKCKECETTPPYFDETYCLDHYGGELQKPLLHLKYQRRLFNSSGLALAWNRLTPSGWQNPRAKYLLPAPLSQAKLCMRGFNQSWEIARKLDVDKSIQKNPHILMRHHHTHQQAAETRVNRQLMIRDMFYINPLYQEALEGQTIIVFDDVMTTGATLNEIARILKDNGASQVINWVLLRTLQPRLESALQKADYV
jgi:ComF family protein